MGRHFARQLVERGASTVYTTARTPALVDLPGVEVLQLDSTDPASVAAAAAVAADVSTSSNNAGIETTTDLITGDLADVRREMETHYFGTLNVVRAFAPVLAANGGGAIPNVLSAVSWAKAAAAGVTVTLEATAGVPHVFVAMVGLLEEASLALDNGGRFLRTHLTLASH